MVRQTKTRKGKVKTSKKQPPSTYPYCVVSSKTGKNYACKGTKMKPQVQ